MRKLLCGISCALCISCILAAFVEFYADFDNPPEATQAMVFWVAWGWVFAILNYVTLPPGRPPPVDVVGKWRQLCQVARELGQVARELARVFVMPQQEFGFYYWLAIVLLFVFTLSLLAPAVQNARRASGYSAAVDYVAQKANPGSQS